jgi:cobyrinic acid a,c-diamide synthase
LRAAAASELPVWGECGGYMVLGRALVDAEGTAHPMAGLLPVVTSFVDRKRHLGYRRAVLRTDAPIGRAGAAFAGHEFHYAAIVGGAGEGEALLDLRDAAGRDLGPSGHRAGSVAGSFLHPIDRAA